MLKSTEPRNPMPDSMAQSLRISENKIPGYEGTVAPGLAASYHIRAGSESDKQARSGIRLNMSESQFSSMCQKTHLKMTRAVEDMEHQPESFAFSYDREKGIAELAYIDYYNADSAYIIQVLAAIAGGKDLRPEKRKWENEP